MNRSDIDPPTGGKKKAPNQALGNATSAMNHITSDPTAAQSAAVVGADAEDSAFHGWASRIEGRMGNGYSMDRQLVRDRYYTDPRTGKPYSEEAGYQSLNRMRGKDNYYNSFKEFGANNNIPLTSAVRQASDKAFYQDYPRGNGQTYDSYDQLPANKVPMYMDPMQYGKQRRAWMDSLQKQVPVKRAGGIMYNK